MSFTPLPVQWIKVTKSYTDFSAASLTNTITIATLPVNSVITNSFMVVRTGFLGGTIATYTISLGYLTVASVMPAINSFAAVGITTGTSSLSPGLNLIGTSPITATAVSTVGLLNAATQGSVDIYILTGTLP